MPAVATAWLTAYDLTQRRHAILRNFPILGHARGRDLIGPGMALAERWLATRFNRPGHEVVDHYTYALVSDGDMQEGVTSEAASRTRLPTPRE